MNYGKKFLKKLARQIEAQQARRELQDDLQRLQLRCRAVKADGKQCQAVPLAGGYYCKAHTPK